MKKENKDSMSIEDIREYKKINKIFRIIGWILILFCVISFFFVLLYPWDTEYKYKFKITKTECWNETNYSKYDCSFNYYSTRGNKLVINPQLYPYLNKDGSINVTKEFIEKFCDFKPKPYCEEVEVEEIFINKECGHKCHLMNFFTALEYRSCYETCGYLYNNKENIEIQWLDENCDCDEINKPCSDLKCSNGGGKCLEYTCGDYKVEVLE